ncbi:growth/differentiation factor 8 [Ixodes scapularis]
MFSSTVRTKEEKGNLRRGFWLQLEAKKLVSHWFRHPADNLGLVVHAYDAQGRKLLAVTDPPPGRDSLVSATLLRANDGAWSASDQNGFLERHRTLAVFGGTNGVNAVSSAAPGELGLVPEWQAVHFRFSESVQNLHVAKAHLWVFVSSNQSLSGAAWVTLYQVARDAVRGPHLVKVRTKEEKGNLRRGFWLQLEAKKLVSHWFRHPADNLGLVVHAYDAQGRKLLAVTDPPPGRDSLRPFLVVMVESGGRSRARRMVGLNCQENSSEERCCRYPLTVDFEEFGWDWIIAPKRYEANYCSGECPYVFMQKYPHTHLIQQVNLSGTGGPCCAPRKISAISMLYFDDNHNIIYGVLPGMIVDRCGCY